MDVFGLVPQHPLSTSVLHNKMSIDEVDAYCVEDDCPISEMTLTGFDRPALSMQVPVDIDLGVNLLDTSVLKLVDKSVYTPIHIHTH